MEVFDKINNKYGSGTLKLGSGLGRKPADGETLAWQLKRDYLSPRYSTNINEIPLVY